MMHAFAESDESTDSDENERSSIIPHSRAEPLNWYIANHEWSMGHVSREANQSPNTQRNANQRDDDKQWASKSQECAELLRKKCHLGDVRKQRLKKCCACCCQKTSGTSISDDRSETKRAVTGASTKKRIANKTSPNEEEKLHKEKKIPDKRAKTAREKDNKKRGKQKVESGKKHLGRTEDELLPEMITAGASADITKSCCYLCAQNSMAIVAARLPPRPTEQLTRGTQLSEMPQLRTVQSSVKVRTCDRSTDCPRSGIPKRKKLKLKSFKSFSKYVKKFWPAEKTVACGSDTPIKKRTRKTCGTKECRRYASTGL